MCRSLISFSSWRCSPLLRCSVWCFIGFKSVDFADFLQQWYALIKASGIASLRADFSNCSPAYIYCIYLVTKVLPGLTYVATTVMLNSAFWGQADSICTMWLLAGTYFLPRRREAWVEYIVWLWHSNSRRSSWLRFSWRSC